ncbi:lysophospholipase L1-like esterase [Promicromonospora sp. AC04]|uniref:SGNH/GDSL hydrolase family protein n=1 Tax=Promicromonospora sp. AC04 TaxID=2135723 RepID=UPI000D43856B|nr:SGNH/GDSL hydrolase family protein [Promicromonospora sp. AC04]PUB25584.1 lysophospholipase L1-like esterase [Promicromonospora sp. AC04]
MKRWLMSGGIVASVVVALVAAVVVGMIAGAGGTAAGDTSGEASGSPSPTASPSASASAMVPTVTVEKKPVALFVGDSYTVGQGSSAPEKRWSTIVADKMGWAERNEAQGGTGYVSRSVTIPKLSYGEQLRAASKEGVDVVVIAGGQNDFDELEEDPELVFSAVARAFKTAHQKFPDARIIAVGPSTPWEIGLEARALDSAVRAAAEQQGATYVSLIDPDVVLDQYVHEDGIHVTDEGYAAIAHRVISQIS